MKLIIRVEAVDGRCPCYTPGDQIVLDNGYCVNLAETTKICLHSMGAVMPFYVALAKGVPASRMGLAKRGSDDPKAYVHCPDPCHVTGGGTVLLSIERVEG